MAEKNGIRKEMTNGDGHSYVKNPNMENMKVDHLYHLALSTDTNDLPRMFGDVKFVCMGGTPRRMEAFARLVKQELNIVLPAGADLYDIGRASYRYSLFKAGPVLSVSHGMGIPSLSILMHEVIKLVYHARCTDVTFLRLGTSGGIGLPGGTLVVSNATVDGLLRPTLRLHVLGKTMERPALLDQSLVKELIQVANKEMGQHRTVQGTTMCTYDFYEGQGRLDGAFCDFTDADKQRHLRKIQKEGVVNIEMESLAFAAMCHHAGIRGGVICVTLLDRLQGDQVSTDKTTLEEWQLLPQRLALNFIRSKLKQDE